MIEYVIYTPEAEQDVADAYNWYEAREPGLGEDFLRCVEACVLTPPTSQDLNSWPEVAYIRSMIMLMNSGGVAMTNSFLIADEKAKEAVVFDAPDHTVELLLKEAAKRGWEIKGLWLTHGHFDHFADHAVVKSHFPAARILIHALDEEKVRNPSLQTRLFGLPFVIPPLKPGGYVTDKQKLHIGSMEVEVMHTPGHSPGHVAYYLPGEKLVVGGDLIIGGSIGRTDLPDSDHEAMEASVRRVMALPGATRLLGGHGPATTLEEERQNNFFVRDILSL